MVTCERTASLLACTSAIITGRARPETQFRQEIQLGIPPTDLPRGDDPFPYLTERYGRASSVRGCI
jgi:hypothetical protein